MPTTLMQRLGGQVIWHDTDVLPDITPAFFDPDWQHAQGTVTGSATGRGAAVFLRVGGHDLVLRSFRRGGLIGKLVADRYLRTGHARSRAFREYMLLDWMRAQGLPVPQPVAARYAPRGPWYRADLVTVMIPNATPLADVLQAQPLAEMTWSAIGTVIRQMHELDVCHTDLNCRNILLDADNQPWLIDFDKCARRASGPWKQQNLERLKRSLEKERAKHPALQWTDKDWTALQAGYGA